MRLQRERNLVFVHPFNGSRCDRGQGTIAMEILHQYQPLTVTRSAAVFCAIGGGGLISGIATYIKSLYPGIQVIGVQTEGLLRDEEVDRRGHPVDLSLRRSLLDGTAVKAVGDETFRVCSEYVDDIVLVDSTKCARPSATFLMTPGSIVEPAGALGAAGAKRPGPPQQHHRKRRLSRSTAARIVNFVARAS